MDYDSVVFFADEELINCSLTLTVLKRISSSKFLLMYICAAFKGNCDKYDVLKFNFVRITSDEGIKPI